MKEESDARADGPQNSGRLLGTPARQGKVSRHDAQRLSYARVPHMPAARADRRILISLLEASLGFAEVPL
jgi:hypothetical protein